jgi:hypothetical protein
LNGLRSRMLFCVQQMALSQIRAICPNLILTVF